MLVRILFELTFPLQRSLNLDRRDRILFREGSEQRFSNMCLYNKAQLHFLPIWQVRRVCRVAQSRKPKPLA
jgi:hypothetical protein